MSKKKAVIESVIDPSLPGLRTSTTWYMYIQCECTYNNVHVHTM